jgi:hypothetical protein
MTIKLLVNVDAPNIRSCLNDDLERDIRTLAVDCLERMMQRNTAFPIRLDVIALPSGTALTAPSEIVVQLISKIPLLTKADACQRFNVTPRTIERNVKKGKFPRPVYIHGPRWRAEDIASFETASQPAS